VQAVEDRHGIDLLFANAGMNTRGMAGADGSRQPTRPSGGRRLRSCTPALPRYVLAQTDESRHLLAAAAGLPVTP
jgi:hypothetical protein